MPSDYDAITRHNEEQLGKDTSSRRTQVCMYSDPTHFIYEILQNADDYGATEVSFILTKNGLSIEHNGIPFKTENVKAITYFGKSTSREDLVKTGRFGVGFKSVFAFTATPKIFSGDENFKIYGLYRLKDEPCPQDLESGRTRIVLPFNHEQKKPDFVDRHLPANMAYKRIEERLTSLNMNTLLFTRNIREINWETSEAKGNYLREDRQKNGYRTSFITDGDNSNRYLVFSRDAVWHGKTYKPVEIAFMLDENNQIAPLDDYLYVLFATKQETHLQFILNGPYRTNPSRENISEEDNFNHHLIKETTELIEETLPVLRDNGFLAAQMLGVFPIPEDNLQKFYMPIIDTVQHAFKNNSLIPTDSNSYDCAKNLYRGPAQIRTVIRQEELGFLSGRKGVEWVKGVQTNSRSDKFLESLEIPEWGWYELGSDLESKCYDIWDEPEGTSWLAKRPDKWMQELYLLLGVAINKEEFHYDLYSVKDLQLIRVNDGDQIEHVAGCEAYFPNKGSVDGVAQVKKSILDGTSEKQSAAIRESLKALGVSEIGEKERIQNIINTRYGKEDAEVSRQEHLEHMKTFIAYWKETEDANMFREAVFMDDINHSFFRPCQCYIDEPLHKTGLKALYERAHKGIDKKHLLWNGYRKLTNDDFLDFAVDCGVEVELNIEGQYCSNHPNSFQLKIVGGRETSYRIDRDYMIPNLKEMLALKDININRLVWESMCKSDPNVFEATYRPNATYRKRTDKSSIIILISNEKWLPDENGEFHKPEDIDKTTLHASFRYNNKNGWLDEIKFGEKTKQSTEEYRKKKEVIDELGIPYNVLDSLYKMPPDKRKEWGEEIGQWFEKKKNAAKKEEDRKKKIEPYHEALAKKFSDTKQSAGKDDSLSGYGGSTKNPARRGEKIAKEIAEGIANEGKSGSRHTYALRKKWKGKDDAVRTALKDWYGGKCQICGKTFKQRNEEPYFEGVYLVSYTTASWRDRVGNVLCLCPWHSAMFQYGEKHVAGDLPKTILGLGISDAGSDGKLPLALKLCGEDVVIRFVENHIMALQKLIKAEQDDADKES